MDLAFPPSLGDDHHVVCSVASTNETVLVFFNTNAKIKTKATEFGGPEGWKIVPCAPNPSECTSVVFCPDAIDEGTLDEVCELYGLRLVADETAEGEPSAPGDMSMLLTLRCDARIAPRRRSRKKMHRKVKDDYASTASG